MDGDTALTLFCLKSGTRKVWDRSSTSDTLLGTARVPITKNLDEADEDGWRRLVGSGDQVWRRLTLSSVTQSRQCRYQ